MILYAAGVCEWTDVLRCLAIFTTSSIRGRRVPPLAYQILDPDSAAATLAQRLHDLRERLDLAGLDDSLTEAMAAHTAVGLPNKSSAWTRASQIIRPLVASAKQTEPSSVQPTLAKIQRSVATRRSAMLTEDTLDSESTVQLMNLHQTKGREADATVVVLRANDFFGTERNEPFEEGSRLLYVVFSRARKQIVVLILGTQLNPLVAPFIELAQS
jgi:DNA helicase-2/ATP-dependent DNA helicase PcrA